MKFANGSRLLSMGKNRAMTEKVHIWAPDLFSATGGIQAFSRFFVEALSAEARFKEIRVLVKNDHTKPRRKGPPYFDACGHWPSQMRSTRFATECLRRVWRKRPDLIVSTHLNFGP